MNNINSKSITADREIFAERILNAPVEFIEWIIFYLNSFPDIL